MDRDIAMVFQNYALYPHMSVYDNMAFGLKMRKFDRAAIAKRVQEAAEILGIEQLLQRKPRQLSGGQRQRVALGRAIVRHPQVFLFDEPLSNLDAKLRVQMRVELKKLHDRLGTTAIYVTDDQVETVTLGDRVVVMKDGLIQQVGEPLELYNEPADRFVAIAPYHKSAETSLSPRGAPRLPALFNRARLTLSIRTSWAGHGRTWSDLLRASSLLRRCRSVLQRLQITGSSPGDNEDQRDRTRDTQQIAPHRTGGPRSANAVKGGERHRQSPDTLRRR